MKNADINSALRMGFGVFFMIWGVERLMRTDTWASTQMLGNFFLWTRRHGLWAGFDRGHYPVADRFGIFRKFPSQNRVGGGPGDDLLQHCGYDHSDGDLFDSWRRTDSERALCGSLSLAGRGCGHVRHIRIIKIAGPGRGWFC